MTASKATKRSREAFRDMVQGAFKDVFGVALETEYNIIQMALVSRRADGKKLTKEQAHFLSVYERAYHDALDAALRATAPGGGQDDKITQEPDKQ